jgi:hypothetical protein
MTQKIKARVAEREIREEEKVMLESVRRMRMGRGGWQFGVKIRGLEEDDRITFKRDLTKDLW